MPKNQKNITASLHPPCSASLAGPPFTGKGAHSLQRLPDDAPWQQQLCHGVPASNKPHPSEKSTPVWLAIWRTWAGFANSQHRNAAFATPDNICAHSSLLPHWAAAQTDANLSAHLPRLPTPPPHLRRMRLLPGWGAGIRWVIRLSRGWDASVRWVIRLLPGRMRRSCKSPRARIPVLGTSGAHWPARWPRFELTERVDKS